MLDKQSLTQSPRLLAPCTTKLQSRRVGQLHNQRPYPLSLSTQYRLCDCLPACAKPSVYQLQLLNLRQQALVLDSVHEEGGQLIGCIVCSAPRFPEADVSARYRDQWVTVWLCQTQVCVVLGGVNMEFVFVVFVPFARREVLERSVA